MKARKWFTVFGLVHGVGGHIINLWLKSSQSNNCRIMKWIIDFYQCWNMFACDQFNRPATQVHHLLWLCVNMILNCKTDHHVIDCVLIVRAKQFESDSSECDGVWWQQTNTRMHVLWFFESNRKQIVSHYWWNNHFEYFFDTPHGFRNKLITETEHILHPSCTSEIVYCRRLINANHISGDTFINFKTGSQQAIKVRCVNLFL